MKRFALLLLASALVCHAQQYTRGIGVYPGLPSEYTGPSMQPDSTYRNLALHRPAYQSSAIDYNLTAQLVTDGIVDHRMPQWIVASTSSGGILDKENHADFLDGNTTSSVDVTGPHAWVEFHMDGGGTPPEVDRLDLWLRRLYGPLPASGWTYTVLGSQDGKTWTQLGQSKGTQWPSMDFMLPSFNTPIPLATPAHDRYYKVELHADGITHWGVALLAFSDQGRDVNFAGPHHFTSAWMSASGERQWVYVDLGAPCKFNRVQLDWIQRPASGEIQISSDAHQWKSIQALPSTTALTDDIRLPRQEKARYVRVLMTKPENPGGHYILSEMQVWGTGGLIPVAQAQRATRADGTIDLAGGAWKLQRQSLVAASGRQISEPGFSDAGWMIATVPGTVLTSYLNDGAVPNPDYGANQYDISDSFFCSNFWYRDTFIAPAATKKDAHFWLTFNGINWKAEVYLNGRVLGPIDGAFMRARFNVTGILRPGEKNVLAVLTIANAHPGSTKDKAQPTVNGGALGQDNPTFEATAGWDWMSTIRGRDEGIWSNVTLRQTGPVTITQPLVSTTLPLPDTSQADVSLSAVLTNHQTAPISGTLEATFGSVKVQTPVTLNGDATKTVSFTPKDFPSLHLRHPKLWWPVGYGKPNLYPVTLQFTAGGQLSDRKSFHAGVRQFTYSETGGLKMWINGRRFIARGGNWGFSESMLRYRKREYDTAMEFHRDEHFDMIRNWVGQIGDSAFYSAADKYGVVIWQDFWLANPWDGPNPNNDALFLANARNYLLRIRNHPSLGLFCGRNEGYPPSPVDDSLRTMVGRLVPHSHYISSSADGPVSGHGPYRVEPLPYYFTNAPKIFHSEMGSPNIPEMATLERTMPKKDLWPQNSVWPLHDFHAGNVFTKVIEKDYGGANNIQQWDSLAQFVDYNAYRGMFEGSNTNRVGLLIWMSHPAWPSLLWQTYDYFYDTDAGYFGAKKGAEPLHIQWNAATNAVEVVNDSAGNQTGLTAKAEVINLDGKVKWQHSTTVNSSEDSTIDAFPMQFPSGLSETHFIRLELLRNGKIVSRNFYLRGLKQGDYTGIRQLAKVKLKLKTHVERVGDKWELTADLKNDGKAPALMVRIKVVRSKTGDEILPAFIDNNYIALMPGEKRTLHATVLNQDTRGQKPKLILEGYNVKNPGTVKVDWQRK